MSVGGLCRAANRAESGGIEIAGHAVEALFNGSLIVPAHADVERQPRRDAPVVLDIKAHEALGIEGAGVHRNVTAGGQAK